MQSILLLEDSEADQILIKRVLFKAEIFANVIVCDTKEHLIRHLKYSDVGLVLLDYHVPNFDFNEAFEIIQNINLDIPIIYVTGSVPADIASETSLAHADAFVIKDNLKDLPLVIQSVYYHRLAEKEKEKAESLTARMNEIDRRLRMLMEKNKVYMEFLNKNNEDSSL